MRKLLLASIFTLATLPALAGYNGTPPGGGAVTMGGDISGQSSGTTVTKLNGATPGGSCPSGQVANGTTTTAAPTNCLTVGLGFAYRSGNWYMGFRSGTGTSLTLTAGTIFCGPLLFLGTATPTILGTRVATAATSGSYISLGVFANGSNERPTGTALMQLDQLASTSTATTRYASISGVSLAGYTKYWECAWSDGNPAIGATGVSNAMLQLYGNTDGQDQASGSYAVVGYSTAISGGYTSTFPDLTGLTWTTNTAAAPALKFQF